MIMLRSRSLLVLCSVLGLHAHALHAQAADYHFVNGNLLTMESSQPIRAELLISDGVITAVGESLNTDGAAVRIDLEGGYLMPGLSEMHAHVPAGQGETYRDEVLFLFVANGVTTIRGMLGHPDHLPLRKALADNQILGPRLITSGPSFNGRSGSTAQRTERMVREQHAAGYDFLKIHPGVPLAAYDAMVAVADELGMPFVGHIPQEVGLLHALASGQATIDHLDGYVQALVANISSSDDGGLFAVSLLPRVDEKRIALVADATFAAQAWVVPTHTLLQNFAAAGNTQAVFERPQNLYLPPGLLANYKAALNRRAAGVTDESASKYLALRDRLVKQLHDKGVGILLGSDAPQIFNVPGFSVHRELAAMVAAGLTPFEALQTGTTNPATYFDQEAVFGKLIPGLSADLIWLARNPVEDIDNTREIRGVMVRGRWLDRQEIDEGLAAIRSRHGN